MELNEEIIEEVLTRLFKIFEKNDIKCNIYDTWGNRGWHKIDTKKDFDVLVQCVKENNPDIYENYNLINHYVEMAEAFSNGSTLNEFIDNSFDLRDKEKIKIQKFKSFIDTYENYNFLFPENKNLEFFYKYCKDYINKDIKIQELYKKFKEKKLYIPEQNKILDLKKLTNYMRVDGRVAICCKLTNFYHINILCENLWKYYYLSLLTEEPLLFYNLNNRKYEEIYNLFI